MILEGTSHVCNLNVDWPSGNLYFFDDNSGTIDILNGKYRKKLVNFASPWVFGGMTLDLHNRSKLT